VDQRLESGFSGEIVCSPMGRQWNERAEVSVSPGAAAQTALPPAEDDEQDTGRSLGEKRILLVSTDELRPILVGRRIVRPEQARPPLEHFCQKTILAIERTARVVSPRGPRRIKWASDW